MALSIGGCFGGGSDDAVVAVANAVVDVPDSAGASVAAFLGYILALSSSDEASEPSALKATFDVPPNEAAEPRPLT